jgi:hypothetical protein
VKNTNCSKATLGLYFRNIIKTGTGFTLGMFILDKEFKFGVTSIKSKDYF